VAVEPVQTSTEIELHKDMNDMLDTVRECAGDMIAITKLTEPALKKSTVGELKAAVTFKGHVKTRV